MNQYVFYKLSEKMRQQLDVEDLAVPVRKERVTEVFGAQEVAGEKFLDELDAFLAECPQYLGNYQEFIGRLAYFSGAQLGRDGYQEIAAHYFELGLKYNPQNLSLRANYAVALQGLGRIEQALAQYEAVINDSDSSAMPMVWMLAARLYEKQGNFKRCRQLLEACAKLNPDDGKFWQFYSQVKEKSGVVDPAAEKGAEKMAMIAKALAKGKPAPYCLFCYSPSGSQDKCPACGQEILKPKMTRSEPQAVPSPVPAGGLVCRQCGNRLADSAKFCGKCGTTIAAAQAPQKKFCFSCGQELAGDAKFCNNCGTAIE